MPSIYLQCRYSVCHLTKTHETILGRGCATPEGFREKGIHGIKYSQRRESAAAEMLRKIETENAMYRFGRIRLWPISMHNPDIRLRAVRKTMKTTI